ncbi:hypothetical protein CRH09_30385 [Nocardia terpenica]|uniref:Uncharacterized protein n=1 Tax=Nocardia terpenica TaxID=455432 RepID=A0A291RRG6_9NOCA|nr:hypothetical protein CRH09_30385 [Nocardia terpenica]
MVPSFGAATQSGQHLPVQPRSHRLTVRLVENGQDLRQLSCPVVDSAKWVWRQGTGSDEQITEVFHVAAGRELIEGGVGQSYPSVSQCRDAFCDMWERQPHPGRLRLGRQDRFPQRGQRSAVIGKQLVDISPQGAVSAYPRVVGSSPVSGLPAVVARFQDETSASTAGSGVAESLIVRAAARAGAADMRASPIGATSPADLFAGQP